MIFMLSKEEFKKVSKKVPLIAVDGVLFKDGSVLMVKRVQEPYKGYWAVPGGFVEYKEKLEHAIVREVKEESGLNVKTKGIVGIYADPNRDPRGHVISICFLLKLAGGKIKTSDETSDVKFFKKLPGKISLDYRKMIKNAKKMVKKIK